MPARHKDLKAHFDSMIFPDPNSGCWLWGGMWNHGYGMIRYGKMHLAHRMSWELNIGPIPDGLYVLHKCDTRPCVNPDHLFLGTYLDNSIDASRKGRGPGQKVTIEQVLKIRADGRAYASIGEQYGISESQVSRIKNKKRFAHVDDSGITILGPRLRFAGRIRCKECNGKGEVYVGERHGFAEADTCPVCRGDKVITTFAERKPRTLVRAEG